MKLKIFHARDFIRATPEGEVNLAKSEQQLAEIAAATADLDDYEILIDIRQAKGALTPNELWSLSQQLLKYRRTFSRRTVVLCPQEKFDRARFFALCAENSGFNIHVFTSYEDAMEWLLSS